MSACPGNRSFSSNDGCAKTFVGRCSETIACTSWGFPFDKKFIVCHDLVIESVFAVPPNFFICDSPELF